MNKQHTYLGYTFNIKVELNFNVERRLNGKRFHKVTINDMGATNYYEAQLVETHKLKDTINTMIEEAERWADVRINGDKSEEVIILESLGFK